jgi:hypothetical protein
LLLLLLLLLLQALNFFSFDVYSNMLSNVWSDDSNSARFVAGALAGAQRTTACCTVALLFAAAQQVLSMHSCYYSCIAAERTITMHMLLHFTHALLACFCMSSANQAAADQHICTTSLAYVTYDL